MSVKEPAQIKLVVCGDGGVGKTSLLCVYKEGKFPEKYVPTVFDNYNCKIMVDGEEVDLSLHDTAGQEEFKGIRTLAYMGADVIAICFSLVDKSSFINAQQKWEPEVRRFCKKSPVILVGTKMDLKRDDKFIKEMKQTLGSEPVDFNEANELCTELKCSSFVQCSAKTSQNVKKVFNDCVRFALIKKKKKRCVII